MKKSKKGHKKGNFNEEAHWKAYQELQTQADKAWKKLQGDVKRNAGEKILTEDNQQIMLLLGECDYMARECMRMASNGKKEKRRSRKAS